MIDGAEINRYEFSNPNKYFNFVSTNIKSGGDYSVYKKLRIVVRQIGQTPIIGICEPDIVTSNTLYNLYLTDEKYSLKYILAILNSNLIKKYWLSNYSDGKQLFPKIKGYQLKQLPIKIATKNDQQPFIEKADLMLSLNKDLQEVSLKFSKYFSGQFKLDKLSGKLEKWYELSFEEFIKEIKKSIKAQKGTPLTKKDEFDWIDLFEENKQKANALQTQIATTDKAIDAMVYELYGLSEEEIKIVEQS